MMRAFGAEAFLDRVKGARTDVAEDDTESSNEQGPFGSATVPMSLVCCWRPRGRCGWCRRCDWSGFCGWRGLCGSSRLWNFVTHEARMVPEEEQNANVAMLA